MKKKMSILKQLRNRLGITQETLARKMDVSVFQISRWESGSTKFSVNLRQFKKFLELLKNVGIEVSDLPDDIWGDLSFPEKM